MFLLSSCNIEKNNYFGLTYNDFDKLIGAEDYETSLDAFRGENYKIEYGIEHIFGYFSSRRFKNIIVYNVYYDSNDEFGKPMAMKYEEINLFDDITFITSPSLNPIPKVSADGFNISLIEAISEGILSKEEVAKISSLFNIYYKDYIDDYLKNKGSETSFLSKDVDILTRKNFKEIIELYSKKFNLDKENVLLMNYYGNFESYYFVELFNNNYDSKFNDLTIDYTSSNKTVIHDYNFIFPTLERSIFAFNNKNNELVPIDELDNISVDLTKYLNEVHKAFYEY